MSSHHEISSTTNGGRHETAVRSAVIIFGRRHDFDASEGFRTHDVGSLTRPAQAAKRPGRRNGFAALSHQFQIARHSPSGGSSDRPDDGFSSSRRPAAFIDQQMRTDTAPGHGAWGMCRFTPADDGRRGQSGFSFCLTCLPDYLGAGISRRPFALSRFSRIGRSNARLGSNLSLRDSTLQRIRQGRPSHFQNSVSCGPTQPRETEHEVPEIRAFGTPDDC